MILYSAASEVQPIRIVIADRDRMGSQLLAESLGRHKKFEVSAAGVAGDLFLQVPRPPHVAVISTEFNTGTKRGLQVTHGLRLSHPAIRVVVLLEVDSRESVISSFRCGAAGVFCRTEPLSDLHQCIEQVSRGQIWTSSVQTHWLLEGLRSAPSCDGIDGGKIGLLSKRELEVAEHAAQGQSNRQIAEELNLSEHTVKNYLFRIFEKLNVSSRFELLFLLFNERKNAAISATESEIPALNSIESYIKAARDGDVGAQYLVGLAHLEGCGIERNGHSAYYWLRMAEENSGELRRRTHALTQELKSKMKALDLETLERNVAASVQQNSSHISKQPAELINRNAGLQPLPVAI
jgi:two-component system, NarL family, nitrate/nitrite response regulator NarL